MILSLEHIDSSINSTHLARNMKIQLLHNVDPSSFHMNSREIEEEWKHYGSTSGYPQGLNRIERDSIPNTSGQ